MPNYVLGDVLLSGGLAVVFWLAMIGDVLLSGVLLVFWLAVLAIREVKDD